VWCDDSCVSADARRACSSRVTDKVACPVRGSCLHDGTTYIHGAGFMSADGCNRCTCWDGLVACTEKLCLGCESVLCMEGTTCVMDGGHPVCVKNAPMPDDPCMSVKCAGRCVANNDGTVSCIPISTCEYNGQIFKSGDSFSAGDGCNHCSCTEGRVLCTMQACLALCNYDGVIHYQGESFPSSDGCNTCSCSSGHVICTDRACIKECTTDTECGSGYCHKDSCLAADVGTCSDIAFACTMIYDPVCGCDRQTYGNSCVASAHGVNIVSAGACDITTKV